MAAAVGRLHILTDTHLQDRFTHLALAKMAVAAGAGVVQYREKAYSEKQHLEELIEIQALTQGTTTQLVVNDDVQLALQIGADGVHLGADDTPPSRALQLLGPESIVGVTVHNHEELVRANALEISYVGIGPVFGSTSKETGLPPLGLVGLAQLCRASRHPVIAIGSIQATDVQGILDAGAYGVAILSAFCLADDPTAAAASFLYRLPAM